ncbi:MAG: DoxX family protein [Vulcanimicrobiaceae bacterium]
MVSQPGTQEAPSSEKRLWAGRIVSAIAVLFLLLDGVIHVMNIAPVVEAFARLGFPDTLALYIGIIELVCIAVYVIPRTAVLGAVLLTGYLGGAVATQVRAGSTLFEAMFPIILGVLIWSGLLLRDDRLRALIPLRN